MAVPSLTTVVTHSLPCTCPRTEQAAQSLRRGLGISPAWCSAGPSWAASVALLWHVAGEPFWPTSPWCAD